MNALLTGLLVVCLSGCMKDANYPPANLDYQRIVKALEPDYFDLYFSSDLSLDSIFRRSEGISRTSETLECSLEQPAVFAMDHVMVAYGMGLLDREGQRNGRFAYKASLFFAETREGGQSERHLYRDRFAVLVGKQSSILCKVKISAFGFKAYYSQTFYLPVADVLPLVPLRPASAGQ